VSPYPATTAATLDPVRQTLGRRLLEGLAVVRHSQHPSGEIVAFRADDRGNHIYCRTPFVSAHVHDALACFDRTAGRWVPGALALVPTAQRTTFERAVIDVRARIRGFVLWQQEEAGWWRFFGRGSGIDPDAATTAVASVAVADTHTSRSLRRWERQHDVVMAFADGAGRFASFHRPGVGGYGWMDDAGRPVAGVDRLVNMEVLRFLELARSEDADAVTALASWLAGEIATGDLLTGTALAPNPLTFLYAAARTLAETGLPGAGSAPPLVTALTTLAGRPGCDGPLSTAMRATALLDLGAEADLLAPARLAVLRSVRPDGGWGYEDFLVHGFGSPALTSALSIAFLARHAAEHGFDDAGVAA
jgi:hypothetical protein